MGLEAGQGRFNLIRHRGDPHTAVLASGHTVTKQDYIYIPDGDGVTQAFRCADYHGEHFIYANPLYLVDGPEGRGHWFAMCTCGSQAIKIGPTDVRTTHETGAEKSLLVCYVYMLTLESEGVGRHVTGHKKWW